MILLILIKIKLSMIETINQMLISKRLIHWRIHHFEFFVIFQILLKIVESTQFQQDQF